MKKICITIDIQTEDKLKRLADLLNANRSEIIRYAVDEVYVDKIYNGYGWLGNPPKKKGGEKKRNAKNHLSGQKPTKHT